ncbi:MAG: hypothetical protein GXY89_04995, partial [Tissierellia bacterium]|nr:hypothetical protein [Tissierellia bacterium]
YKLEEGEYTVKVSADGYVANSVDFSVGESQPTTITVELREKTFGDSVDEIIKATTPVMIKNPSTSTGLNYLEALALNKSGEPVENFKEKIGIYPDYVTQNIPKNVISVVAVEGDPSNYNDTNHLTKLPKSVNALSGMSVEETVINLIAMDKAGIKYDETAAMNLLLGKLTVEGDKALVINVEDDGWGYEEETRDTNETAWALIGLAKYKDNSATQDKIAKAKNYLKGQIQDNGNALREWVGYPKKDIQTTALIAQAAVRLGEDPTDWTNSNGKSLIDGIVAGYQGDGVFKTPDGMTSNLDRPHAFAALVDYRNKESMFGPSIEAPTPVDKTDLEKAITNAEAVEQVPTSTDGKDIDKDKTWTTAEELKAFEDAIKAAKDVNTKEDATQEEVDAAVTALNDAVEAYNNAKKAGTKEESSEVNKEALQNLVDKAKEKKEKDYTKETWKSLEEALEKAKEILAKEDATQEEVNSAKTKLEKALRNLKKPAQPEPEPKVDKDPLDKLIAEAEKIDTSPYTKESKEKLSSALVKAKEVMRDPKSTHNQVDQEIENLQKAIQNLERLPEELKPDYYNPALLDFIFAPSNTPTKPLETRLVEQTIKYVIGNKNYEKTVDGVTQELTMDVAPYIKNDRTMVPLRYVGEALGYEVFWEEETRTAILKNKDTEIQIQIDSDKFTVNGVEHEFDSRPEIVEGRTMLSISNIGRALGMEEGKDIFWNGETREVTIIKNVTITIK